MTGMELFFIAASTATAIGSTILSNKAQQQAAMAEGAIADQQASISMQQAADLRRRAEQDRQNGIAEQAAAQRRAIGQRREAERLTATQRAKFANSGVGMWGSAAYVVAETEAQGDYNAEMELWQGDEKARAYKASEVSSLQQANIEERNAQIQRMGGQASRNNAKAIRSGLGIGIASDIAAGGAKMAGAAKTSGTGTGGYRFL